MAIVRAPRLVNGKPEAKCSRWRVVIYNPKTHKQDWHTVEGTKHAALEFERKLKDKLSRGTYVERKERKTVAETVKMFMEEQHNRDRRTSTIASYTSVFDVHVLPELGHKEIGTVRRPEIEEWFARIRQPGPEQVTVATLKRILWGLKALMYFALDREFIERNPVARLKPWPKKSGPDNERHVARDAFTEDELRALITAAEPVERTLVMLLAFTGMRPAEVYALGWEHVDLDAGAIRVERSWDHRGRKFVPPKTKSGTRTFPLEPWLVTELRAHRERGTGEGLVFPTRAGTPINPSNLRRDIWLPLKKRAKVRDLDFYSLRHSFASHARAAGGEAFNVARIMGHSKSQLVDAVYAHAIPSGLAGVTASVATRVMGKHPKLRLIEGGKQDVSPSLDEDAQAPARASVTG